MALIDNEEAARRLARVILSDIELYQQKRIEAGDDMSGDLAEGRALFGRRVAPQLLPIFDATLATRRLGGRGANVPAPAVPVAPPIAVPAAAPAPASPPEPVPQPAPSPVVATASAPEDAVGTEMSQAETGRSVVTAELAQSMKADGKAEEPAEASPQEPAKDPGAASLEALPAAPAAEAVPEAKLATDDRATPVPVEDIVSRPSVGRDDGPPRPSVAAVSDGPPESPDEPAPSGGPVEEDRITARGMAVFTEAEAEPIRLSTPPPPAVVTPPAPIPTPPPIPAAARAATPRPVLVAQKPAEGTRESPTKTPQPLSPPTISPGQSSAGLRVGTPAGSPRVATPFRSSAFQPLNLPPMPEAAVVAAAPAAATPAESPATAPDDVVNLRKKTPKVVVLLVILAVIGGVMLIGRFLTRFI